MIEPRYNLGIGPRDLVRGDVELASPPEVYARITALLDDPAANAARMAEVIEKDPALTARLLKIVNSAFYGFPSKVSTVSRAITIVGMRELQELVLATSVLEKFNGLPNDLVDMRSFWRQSLRCAVVARVMARHHDSPEAAESIFVAGLLHEIGHLIIYRKLPELAREAILRHRHGGVKIYEAEREVFGFDYAAVGSELMRAWKLPPVLCEVVALHTAPQLAQQFPMQTAIVHLARRVAEVDGFDPTWIEANLPPGDPAWKAAGVRTEDLAQLLAEAEEQYEAALSLVR